MIEKISSRFSTIEAIRIVPNKFDTNHNHTNSNTDRYHRQHRYMKYLQSKIAPVNVPIPSNPDDHLVIDLPLLDTQSFTTQHWAGHLPASNNHDKYFFYWLFAPDSSSTDGSSINDSDIPLIIWLNGGPACSSMDGLFIENGPFRFDITDTNTMHYSLVTNPYSWHKAPAYTLYIDQPVGTGLSFTTSEMYPRNDKEVNTDFSYFLQQFFKLHSNKFVNTQQNMMTRKLYFSGESYAGHYIPSLMNYLLKKKDELLNNNNNRNEIIIPVSGGAIGNGWTDPFYQYAGADFAYGQGLIGAAEVVALRKKEKDCQAQLNNGIYSVGICFDLIDDILAASQGSGSNYKASGYDVRVSERKHADREFPPGHKVVETYLGGWELPSNDKGIMSSELYTKVLKSIHASAATAAGQTYQECTDPPYNALAGNDGKGVVDDVVDILKHPDNVRLLFFNGIYDIICNHVGNEKFLEKLPWEHASDWYQSSRYAWIAKTETLGKVSGYMKEYNNLQFLKIMDAGHMVPMDVPNVALDMMKLFVSNGSFEEHKQNLEASIDDSGTCPICPTCLERDSGFLPANNNNNSNNNNNDTVGTITISYVWLVFGVAMVSFCFIVIIYSNRRRSTSTIVHRPVPQYELELREATSSYHDNAENGGIVT